MSLDKEVCIMRVQVHSECPACWGQDLIAFIGGCDDVMSLLMMPSVAYSSLLQVVQEGRAGFCTCYSLLWSGVQEVNQQV